MYPGVSLVGNRNYRIKLILRRNKKEFVELMRRNMKRAYFTALGILGSHDDAMEISQLAFIRAYKHFDSYDESKNFFTWYYKILRNLCLNSIRDSKRKNEVPLFEFAEVITENETASEHIEKEELKSNLERAMMMLESSDREIIVLKEFEGLSYKEISELLTIPVGSVMSRLFYARKKLGNKLESLSR